MDTGQTDRRKVSDIETHRTDRNRQTVRQTDISKYILQSDGKLDKNRQTNRQTLLNKETNSTKQTNRQVGRLKNISIHEDLQINR